MMSFKNKIHNWTRDAEHEKKVDCHPNQEVLLLNVLLPESHHQVHPPADHQKARELYKKS